MWSNLYRKWALPVLLVGLGSLAACAGSGGGGGTAAESAATLAGSVQDDVLAGATVNLYRLGQAAPLSAAQVTDAAGHFRFQPTGLQDNDVLYIVARSGDHIVFRSLLGRWGDLPHPGGTLTSEALADLIVSHVSTAKTALAEAAAGIHLDDPAPSASQTGALLSAYSQAMTDEAPQVRLISAALNALFKRIGQGTYDAGEDLGEVARRLAANLDGLDLATANAALGDSQLTLTQDELDCGLRAVDGALKAEFSGYAAQCGQNPVTTTASLAGVHHLVALRWFSGPPAPDTPSLLFGPVNITVTADASGHVTSVRFQPQGVQPQNDAQVAALDLTQPGAGQLSFGTPDSNGDGLPDGSVEGTWSLGPGGMLSLQGNWQQAYGSGGPAENATGGFVATEID